MIRTRGYLVSALLSCLILFHMAAPGFADVVDRIVAVVNDEVITMSELQTMAKNIESGAGMKPSPKEDKELQRQMLDALIDRKLAREEAKKRGISLSEKEIDQAVAQFRKRNNLTDDESFNKALSNAGLTLKEVKQQIGDQLIQERLLQVMVGTKVMVSDAEIRRVYDERFKQGGGRLHLINAKLAYPPGATEAQKEEIRKKTEKVLTEIKQGGSFMEVAKRNSLDATDMGFVDQNDIDPKLAEFLDKLKPKEVAPVQTPAGFQLIQVLERRTGESRPFEEMAPQIRRMLMQREMEKQFGDWIKTLREKAHIKIML